MVYNSQDMANKLSELSGWEYDPASGAIRKTYGFSGFTPGVEFAGKLAEVADQHEHHPDLEISYGKVVVSFTTHDAGGVTDKDLEMAKQSDLLQS
jgi:4a-hydroxytetrahydrobiopterin dehydratase